MYTNQDTDLLNKQDTFTVHRKWCYSKTKYTQGPAWYHGLLNQHLERITTDLVVQVDNLQMPTMDIPW